MLFDAVLAVECGMPVLRSVFAAEVKERRWPALTGSPSWRSSRGGIWSVLFTQAVADKLGMHPTDLQCLNLMTIEDGAFTTGQIAELTGLTSGSASRLVDRLVKAGCVTRQQDSEDRRRVLVQPVPEAVRRVSAVWDELSEGWSELFSDYTDGELDLLLRHMRRTTQLGRAQVQRLRGQP